MTGDKKNKGFFSKDLKEKKTTTMVAKPACRKSVDEAALDQMIKERAYYLWEQSGRPQGQDFEHWVKAEKDICSKLSK